MNDRNDEPRCSFCGRPQSEVQKLIAGPGVYICDECVAVAQHIMEEEKAEETPDFQLKDLPTPHEIKATLDEYVIGQEAAKKTLSVAVYNHYKRLQTNFSASDDDVELQKSNIVMVGPTGSGKTLLAQTLARLLDVPFAIADATSLTEAGYVGEDVENCLLKLIQAADYDIAKAERGIIYIDEIDKIARKSENPSITRDVSGEGVQQALLKILEGTVAGVPPQGGRKHPHQEFLQIDTTNILFICGGAFAGLESIIKARTDEKTLGFGADIKRKAETDTGEILKKIMPEDLMKFGIIPELVGRLPVVTTLGSLKKEELVRILTEPKNALCRQYRKLLELDNVTLEFENAALDAIAQKAIDRKIGARGLRAVLESVMTKVMYDIPSDPTISEVLITRACVEDGSEPEIRHKAGAARRKRPSAG